MEYAEKASIVEMNLGIIAASMPALPQFFARSKIFHASSYSSLRRLFSNRDPKSAFWVGEPSKPLTSKESNKQRGLHVQRENWTELQSLSDADAYAKTNTSFNDELVQIGARMLHQEA